MSGLISKRISSHDIEDPLAPNSVAGNSDLSQMAAPYLGLKSPQYLSNHKLFLRYQNGTLVIHRLEFLLGNQLKVFKDRSADKACDEAQHDTACSCDQNLG